MREGIGNIWEMWKNDPFDALCVTTNGDVNARGLAIMGRGVAHQAKEKFPGLDRHLGELLQKNGNHVQILGSVTNRGFIRHVVSFPVKHHWSENASYDLIIRSAKELVMLADLKNWRNVVLVQPGTGNGGLKWKPVKGRIEPILDDRFLVVTLPQSAISPS